MDEPQPHLERMKQGLDEQAELVRELLDEHGDTEEAVAAFVAEVDRRTRERRAATTVAVMFEVGSPVEQRWLGLRRYWQKQAERSLARDDGDRDDREARASAARARGAGAAGA